MTSVVTPPCTREQPRRDQTDRYENVGHSPGRDLQALVELAAQICGVPTAAINLIVEAQAHGVATTGFDPSLCARQDSLCAAVLDDPALVVVSDARADDRFRDNPMVTGALAQVRFYASVPLTTDAGIVIGRLCVFDRIPRHLDQVQRTALLTLADRVMDALDLRLRSRELEESLAELTRTRDELRRSNDQLAVFAGQVSHDLRTPLTAIMANAEMLSTEPVIAGDPALAPLATETLRASRRMAGLIDDFLDHATFGSTLVKTDTDLGTLVRGVLADLAPVINDTGAEIVVDELPTVCADPHQLYSVVLNLLSNALKFSGTGTLPSVTVHARTLPDRWCVSIADNGIGIPPSQHRRVFGLYARLEETVEGHGIGLPTAQRIVEAHGGRIGITRDRKVGTEVWFDLPR